MAAALHELLADDEAGPLLVLGSLWPAYWEELTAEPDPGEDAPDPYAAARGLLQQATAIYVPDSFSEYDLRRHRQLLEADPRLVQAAASANGRLSQFLAGAPELIRRYRHASTSVRAVLWAAMDARRLGHGLGLPRAFLEQAAPGYLSDDEWDALDDAWFEKALAYLAEPCRGVRGPLSQIRPRPGMAEAGQPSYRLADYLEQHAHGERRHIGPPAGFWEAAVHAATPQDVRQLAEAAEQRWRLHHAAHLYAHAARHGDDRALHGVTRLRTHTGVIPDAEHSMTSPCLNPVAGPDIESDEDWAVRQDAVQSLMDAHEVEERRQDETTRGALWDRAESFESRTRRELAPLREAASDMKAAEELMAEAVEDGNTRLLFSLAMIRELADDFEGAEAHLRRAAKDGQTRALSDLARLRERAGDRENATRYALEAADQGDSSFLGVLVECREQDHLPAAQQLAHRAADAGYAHALILLAVRRTWAEGTGSPWVRLWRYGLTAEGHISRPWCR
ncbi:hypothetical protein ACFY3E_33030 [Streptomyces griseorubiginosus]|uniref:hypothetical protein n=1 Tax=Streptomyces griseorubiginosus TaxID=67304 RepID=UPI00368EEC74